MHDVIARYLDCWNETDPAARRKLTGKVWGPGPQGGEPHVIGFDVAVTAGNGRIVSVLGFLDRVPA